MISQLEINTTLKNIGSSLLHKNYQKNWTEENPTYGYCYIISEAIYHYTYLENPEIYYINLGKHGVHWFLKSKEKIIDFTAEQFKFPIPYQDAKRIGFLKGSIPTSKGFISKRGFKIAKNLNLI